MAANVFRAPYADVTPADITAYGLNTEPAYLPVDWTKHPRRLNDRSPVLVGEGMVAGIEFELVNHHRGGNPWHIVGRIETT